MKKSMTIFSMAFLLTCAFGFIRIKPVLLQEGTNVSIKLMENLTSGQAIVGDKVTLEVSEDVEEEGIVLIKKGTSVDGTVTESEKAKMGGKKGKIDFTIDFVKAVNGRNVKIRTSRSSSGSDRRLGVAAAAVLVNPAFLLLKGKNVTIEKGKIFTVYVDKDYELDLSKNK